MLFCAACQAPPEDGSSATNQPESTNSASEGFMWEGKYAQINGEKAEISLDAHSMDTAASNIAFYHQY